MKDRTSHSPPGLVKNPFFGIVKHRKMTLRRSVVRTQWTIVRTRIDVTYTWASLRLSRGQVYIPFTTSPQPQIVGLSFQTTDNNLSASANPPAHTVPTIHTNRTTTRFYCNTIEDSRGKEVQYYKLQSKLLKRRSIA